MHQSYAWHVNQYYREQLRGLKSNFIDIIVKPKALIFHL